MAAKSGWKANRATCGTRGISIPRAVLPPLPGGFGGDGGAVYFYADITDTAGGGTLYNAGAIDTTGGDGDGGGGDGGYVGAWLDGPTLW